MHLKDDVCGGKEGSRENSNSMLRTKTKCLQRIVLVENESTLSIYNRSSVFLKTNQFNAYLVGNVSMCGPFYQHKVPYDSLGKVQYFLACGKYEALWNSRGYYN